MAKKEYVEINNLEVDDYVTVWDCHCSEYGTQEVMYIQDIEYLPKTTDKSIILNMIDKLNDTHIDYMTNDYIEINNNTGGENISFVFDKHDNLIDLYC